MMEWEKDLKDPHEFMDALKEDVFNSQVYVFSPKGDVIELPAGSGPIDFAYRVHTNVGNNCVGAKVDGRIVPLDYKLQNGNIIEILTSSNSNGPSRDWLNVAKTPNAKSKIRQWFKKERREDNIERGKGTLERELKRQGFNPNEVLIEKYMSVITKKFNQPTTDDLYATIGYGGIIASQVLGKVKELYEKDNIKKLPEQPTIKSLTEQEYKKKRKVNSQGVVVKGVDNILVRFAKCCNPLPGDEIVGYITKGRGVAVHRLDCPNTMIENTDFKDRIIEVEWNIAKAVKFEAEIQIRAIDKKGIISEITHLIANDKMGLSGINARTSKDRTVNINLLLEVDDINELNSLMNKLKNMQGIEDVYRVIN
jgi:GTP pyrophosphokinase